MHLHRLGEFGLIDRIKKKVAAPRSGKALTLVGLGDDAFAARLTPGHSLVATKDMLIEDVHFRRSWASPYAIGYKSMAVNVSDLAAMGKCRPLFALIGIGLPSDIDVRFVDELYAGMDAVARKFGLEIVGGDTVSSKESIVISVTVLGEIQSKYLLTRGGARPGDVIMATGTFGDAGAGFQLLEKNAKSDKKTRDFLIHRHLYPDARIPEAAVLAESGLVTAMIDASDGLEASVRIIAKESKTGARIDLDGIPVSPPLRAFAEDNLRFELYQLALAGGEDYELVFTARSGSERKIRSLVPSAAVVGEITGGRKVEFYYNGTRKKIITSGFQHFDK